MRLSPGWLGKAWRALPLDGQGLCPTRDPDLAVLRQAAAQRFWSRFPGWSRLPLKGLARLAWIVASFNQVGRFARAHALPAPLHRELFGDCVRSGARANEALIWRRFFPEPLPHPLPGQAAGRVLSQLGDPAQHRLLSDKHATAECLAAAGIATPPLLDMIARGQAPDMAAAVWSKPGDLFVKPRRGAASRGAATIHCLADGRYGIDDDAPIDAAALGNRLAAAAASEDILVQPCLRAAPDLQDLAVTGVAPVLRITGVREPGGAPFLHSALLAIAVPGERSRDFIRGQIRVPIDIVTGRLASGIWFLHPGERYTRLPWNQAPLAGRPVLCWVRAQHMALAAMALLPDLAMVNWDLILTADGPVMLEGNSGGDWILTRLPTVLGMETVALAPLLRRWLVTAGTA